MHNYVVCMTYVEVVGLIQAYLLFVGHTLRQSNTHVQSRK